MAGPGGFAEHLERSPVLLLVLADLRVLAAVDRDLERYTFAGGASVYPFCWSILLAARAAGLGGVLTTMAVRSEPAVKALVGAPAELAVAGLIVLGHPVHRPSRLTRHPVEALPRSTASTARPSGPDRSGAGAADAPAVEAGHQRPGHWGQPGHPGGVDVDPGAAHAGQQEGRDLSGVRLTARGGVAMPRATAPAPMAVGTQPGYNRWRWTPVPSVPYERLSVNALSAAFDGA